MNFIIKNRNPKPSTDSHTWNLAALNKRRKTKRPGFKNKDLKWLEELYLVPGLGHHYGSAYTEDVDDTSSTNSFSTMATLDNIPGTGRTLDMHFYQPVGRAIEKFALKIAIRLNICHPSPALIIRVLGLVPQSTVHYSAAGKKPSDVIDVISAERPTAAPGILSLVEQSQ